MRILLTNDDGIHAPGLRALRKELQKIGEVTVVVGGVIPEQDYAFLKQAGVAEIFGPGTNVLDAALSVLNQIEGSLERFGVHFDTFAREDRLRESGAIDGALERLRAKGYIYDAEGAVWFRSTSFGMSRGLLRKMFWPSPGVQPASLLLAPALLCAAVLAHCGPNSFEIEHKWSLGMRLVLVALFALCLAVIYGGQQTPFLYYQF